MRLLHSGVHVGVIVVGGILTRSFESMSPDYRNMPASCSSIVPSPVVLDDDESCSKNSSAVITVKVGLVIP